MRTPVCGQCGETFTPRTTEVWSVFPIGEDKIRATVAKKARDA